MTSAVCWSKRHFGDQVPTRLRIFRAHLKIAFALALWLSPAATASAQAVVVRRSEQGATLSNHIALLSLNSLIGGVTAGIVRLTRGAPAKEAFADGFLRGAIGGGLSYAGKSVAAQRFDGAGLLGRQLAAIGASTAANAADGIGTFDRILLPLGPIPVRLLVSKSGNGYSARPLIDLVSSTAIVYGLATSRYSFDWGASLSGGVAVFRETEPVNSPAVPIKDGANLISGALAVGGTIFSSYHNNDDNGVLAHERVHVLQFDFFVATLGDRIDTWALTNFSSVDSVLKFNLMPAAFGAVNQTILSLSNHDSYPWEREAALLSGYH